MIFWLNSQIDLVWLVGGGAILALFLAFFLLKALNSRLPRDAGRVFAHEGALSAGKPSGAGLIFVPVFVGATLVCLPVTPERLIDLTLILAAMLTGFLDDRSSRPWGNLKKGLLDLALSLGVALNTLLFRGSDILLPFSQTTLVLPPAVYLLLAALLVWVSINVTNVTDGVDGLSGSLALITLATLVLVGQRQAAMPGENLWIFIMAGTLAAYLWFNATPSLLMMGDAGSRALGLFIGMVVLQTGQPLLYIPAAALLIVDGGSSLVKVSLLRFLKIHILKSVRTPIHDHVRKNLGWSNTQTVFRFALIQLVVSFILLTGLRLLA